MKIYHLLIIVLFYSCKSSTINPAEVSSVGEEMNTEDLSNSKRGFSDSIRVTTELNSKSYELLTSVGGSYWLISTNDVLNSRNQNPLTGQSFKGTLSTKKHKDLFELINRADFNENCDYSKFYKDSIQICKVPAKITHASLTTFQFFDSNYLKKEIVFYEELLDESWQLTNKANNLIRNLISEIELENEKSIELPTYNLKRKDIKKVTIQYVVKGEYGHKNRMNNEISLAEYNVLTEQLSMLKKVNPYVKSNSNRIKDLNAFFRMQIQYENNRSETLFADSNFLRIKNRYWVSLDEKTKEIINGYKEATDGNK